MKKPRHLIFKPAGSRFYQIYYQQELARIKAKQIKLIKSKNPVQSSRVRLFLGDADTSGIEIDAKWFDESSRVLPELIDFKPRESIGHVITFNLDGESKKWLEDFMKMPEPEPNYFAQGSSGQIQPISRDDFELVRAVNPNIPIVCLGGAKVPPLPDAECKQPYGWAQQVFIATKKNADGSLSFEQWKQQRAAAGLDFLKCVLDDESGLAIIIPKAIDEKRHSSAILLDINRITERYQKLGEEQLLKMINGYLAYNDNL